LGEAVALGATPVNVFALTVSSTLSTCAELPSEETLFELPETFVFFARLPFCDADEPLPECWLVALGPASEDGLSSAQATP